MIRGYGKNFDDVEICVGHARMLVFAHFTNDIGA
jgi:hypothetical protein